MRWTVWCEEVTTSEGDVQSFGVAERCGAVDGREGLCRSGRTPALLDRSRAWQSVGEAGRCGVGAWSFAGWKLVSVTHVDAFTAVPSTVMEHSRFQVWDWAVAVWLAGFELGLFGEYLKETAVTGNLSAW